MEELIGEIITFGVRTVIETEPVLGGGSRPLIVHYVHASGTVVEEWCYPVNSAMTKYWGAINGISRYLYNEPVYETIEI